ncbi:uncharacterized protein LOC143299693 [Babylonia areolata]|uniref:uncharacterized protein LOC143299693 n=1 Tax=Babylonia areolata TaxID=304850 RepID=UPI003FD2EDAB
MSYSLELERKFELRDPVTPYVCSTPADFEEERDWLVDHVFPKLVEVCVTRGTYFSPVDVRWSPQDSLTQEGHLLPSLLDLISRSAPYFLCLLGECYGPYRGNHQTRDREAQSGSNSESIDWLELNLTKAAQNGHPWVLQDGHQQCSISELEILAASLRGHSHQCTFYFRQAEHIDLKFPDLSYEERMESSSLFLAESEHAGLKIQSLKQTIVKRGLPVRYFKSLQELGDIVLEDWTAVLDTVCPPLYNNGRFLDTEHYQQWVSREALLTRLRRDFVPSQDMENVMTKLSQFVLSAIDDQPKEANTELPDAQKSAADIFRQKPSPPLPYQTIAVLNGDRGVGKSTLLAQWLAEFADENPGLFLIHHFIGAATGDNDIAAFLRRCTRDLRKHFLLTEVTGYAELDDSSSWWSEEDVETPSDFHCLCQAFVAALSLGPCILLMDGINNLSAAPGVTQQEVKEFDWLPVSLPHHCRIILSTDRADLTCRSLCRRGDVKVFTLPGVKDKSFKMSLLTKTLRPHVLPHIQKRQNNITDMRLTTSPLALCVLGTELNVPTTFQDLERFVDDHYETTALQVFWTNCLQQWITQHSWLCDEEASVISKDDGTFDYSGWVADALCLLSVARGGLLQSELLQLLRRLGYAGNLEVTTLHWLRFRLQAGALLWETSDGRIRFSHQHLHDLTEYALLRSVSFTSSDLDPNCQLPHQSSKRKVHQQLASFFAQQPLSWRQAQELPWHMMMCGDLQGLLSYVTHSRVVHLFLARQSQYPDAHHDLQMYWNILEKHSMNAGVQNIQMLKDLGLYTLPASFTLSDGYPEDGPVEAWLHTNPGITITDQTDSAATLDVKPSITFSTTQADSDAAAPQGTGRSDDDGSTPAPKLSASSRHGLTLNMTSGGETTPRVKLSSDTPRTPSTGRMGSGRLQTAQESHSAAPLRKTSRHSRKTSWSPRREPASDTAGLQPPEESESSEDRVYGRRPLSSPCTYRLSMQLAVKKEATVREPSSKTHGSVLAKRKVSSAPGRRQSSATQKQSVLKYRSAASTVQQCEESTRPTTRFTASPSKPMSRPMSASNNPKTVTVTHTQKGVNRGLGQGVRPVSAPQHRSSVAGAGRKGVLGSSGFVGFFLTAADVHFSCPNLLDGVEVERRKDLMAEVGSAVGLFLQQRGQARCAFIVYSSLLSFLQATYPLSVATQLLVVRVLERLGRLNQARGDEDAARENYHHALRITFHLDTLDEDLVDHRQVDTFKGVLLGHHGYQHLVEGDVAEGGELLKEATESISHLTGNHVLRASLLFHLGLYRGQLGELTRSEVGLRQCLALRKQWHGQQHPEVAAVLLALARLVTTVYRYKHTDQRQEAESLYRKALAVSEQCLGSTHLQVADILAELGGLVAEEEPRSSKMEARKLLQRSLDIRTTVLGADDASTKAARSSVRRVELSLQLGQGDASSSRSEHPQHIALMPQRDLRLPHMGSRAGQYSRSASSPQKGDLGGLDIRSVSREKVLLHNRPDSMMSSAMSLMTASERLLASRPVSSKGRGSRLTSAASSVVGGRVGSMSVGWSAKSMPVEVRLDLDQEDEVGKEEEGEQVGTQRPGTSTPMGDEARGRGSSGNTRTVVLDLDLGEVVDGDDGKLEPRHAAGEDTDEVDTPHLDSFAVHLQDGTIIIGEEPTHSKAKKNAKIRPQSTPHRLFQHYATVATNGSGSPQKARPGRRGGERWEDQGRPSWSARTTASSVGSHVSRCTMPGPYDIVPNTKCLSGPHSDILSLVGPPACPRENIHPKVHHKSAFYHVPGRYPTSTHSYPSRRGQKTEGAQVLASVIAAKMARANRYHSYYGMTYPSSATPRALGVNQDDVSLLVRQTADSRAESHGNTILSSARHPDLGKPNAVTFREPISVT